MTALTMSGPRPLPWRRMGWVTWRQHRLTLAGVAALLGAAALYLLITGLRMRPAYAAVAACHPASSDACQRLANDFFGTYGPTAGVTAGLLHVVAALIGAFLGAPVLAREFETGTFRYAWTQGYGRVRATVAKLVSLAVAVTLAAAAFGLLYAWCYRPLTAKKGWGTSLLDPMWFDLRGVAFPAWTLAAFAIGAFAGVLIRRVIPAMFATLAAWTGLAFATGAYLRRHYEAPLRSTDPSIAAPDWVIAQRWTHGSRPATLAMIDGALHPVGVQALSFQVFEPGPGTPDNFDPVQYLSQHGFTQWTTYQPAGRFWPFQLIEGGWLLALSVLLIAATVWLVRHRAT